MNSMRSTEFIEPAKAQEQNYAIDLIIRKRPVKNSQVYFKLLIIQYYF